LKRSPLDELILEKFKPYVEAVGRVAHTWNQLQESLGQIFADMMGGGHSTALAAWYAVRSDRSQQTMLLAVIDAVDDTHWQNRATAKADLTWLVEKVGKLAAERNTAIHAPVGMALDEGEIKIVPAYFYGNPLAEKVPERGKGMMKELERCEEWATALHNFADAAKEALRHKNRTWPQRPVRPGEKPNS
jgi:hypothetical protein